ncbi:MAG: tetratricopeptide repeat protein [Chloroflexi bacterium]|nr:tetratricopeptide repeat protein [Chloroflexota bacterium]
MDTRTRTKSAGTVDGLTKTARQLRESGRWAELADLLSSNPGGEPSPELMILLAEAAMRTGDLHRSIELLDRLLAESDSLPTVTRAEAMLVRSTTARLRGFPQKALEDASAATALLESEDAPIELLIQGHKQIGIAHGMLGVLDGAIEHLERALRLCARSADLGLQADVEVALGMAFMHLGRYPAAQVHFSNSAAALGKLGRRLELAIAFDNMGRLHFEMGEFERALEMHDQSLAIARETRLVRVESMALVNIGDARAALGQHEEALKAYQEALGPGAEALEPRIITCANAGMASAYRAFRDYRKARFFIGQAIYEAQRQGLKYELGRALITAGGIALDEEDYQEAKSRVTEAVSLLQEAGAQRQLVRAYLYLSQICLRSKRWTALADTLTALAKLIDQLDLADYLAREAASMPEVIEYAASKRIGGSLYPQLRTRLRHERTPAGPAILDAAGGPDASPGMPHVEVRAFGPFEVKVDGRPVPSPEWEGRKAQELFVFLLCHPQGRTKEELIDILWPDMSAGLSRNAFYSNVYRARRAVYRECLVQEGGRYRVLSDGQWWFDIDEFRRLSDEARRAPRASDRHIAALEEANLLYRGDFLEGFYADWVTTMRADAEARFVQNLECLIEARTQRHQLEGAVAALDRLLAVDPTNCEAHERFMKLLVQLGRAAEARQRDLAFRRMLEMDSGPSDGGAPTVTRTRTRRS